jgi:hypothetical protein
MKHAGRVIEIREVHEDNYGWRERLLGWLVSALWTAFFMYMLKISHGWPFE